MCIFILRFIDRTRQAARYLIFVIMAFLIASTLGLVIALLAQRRPLRALYNLDVRGNCYSKNVSIAVGYAQASVYGPPVKCHISDEYPAINVFTDFTSAALPFFILRNLQIRKSLRIGLSIIMGLGFILVF